MKNLIIIFAILVVGFFIYSNYGYRLTLKTIHETPDMSMVVGSNYATDHIVVYIDYADPKSQILYPKLLNLLASDTNLNLIIRPVETDRKNSKMLTRLVLATKKYDRFIDVNNIILTQGKVINNATFQKLATSMGMDYTTLEKIASSPDITEEVKTYKKEAAFMNAKSVPFYFINHVKYTDANETSEQLKRDLNDIRTRRK